MKNIRLFAAMAITSTMLLTACASSDTTKVTVYFSKGGHASLEQNKIPLIDRFLNLFAKKAYAQIHTAADTDYFMLLVIADDFDGAYAVAPGTASSISIEVPSGSDRAFLLNSYSPSGEINYVGRHVTDVSGTDTSFSINMYPCFYDLEAESLEENNYISVNWYYDTTLNLFETVEIYRACEGESCDGTFSSTPLSSNSLAESFTDNDDDFSNDLIPGNVYFYFVRVSTGSFGGGGIPVPASVDDYFSNYYYDIFAYSMAIVTYVYVIN